MTDTENKLELKDTAVSEGNSVVSATTGVSSKHKESSKKDAKSKKEKKSKHRHRRTRSRSDSRSSSSSSSSSRSRSRTRRSKKHRKHRKHRSHRRRSDSSDSSDSSYSRSRSKSDSSSSSSSSRSHSRRRNKAKHHRRDRSRRSSRRHHASRERSRHSTKRHHDNEADPYRSRTRSPHPLLKAAALSMPMKTGIVNDPEKFWDGFQWVVKAKPNQEDPVLLNQTRKMRRFVISNVPLQLGIGEREIGDFVTKFIMENYLNDPKISQHIKEVSIDTALNTATVELYSVEEASRLAKVDVIRILGHNCRIKRAGESKFGPSGSLVDLVNDAEKTAQAQAAVIKAISNYQK